MLEKIYKLLYFTDIGGKIRVNPAESEILWRNLKHYQKHLKRDKLKFKMETFENYTLIWRTK
jgi:hypothetical protein